MRYELTLLAAAAAFVAFAELSRYDLGYAAGVAPVAGLEGAGSRPAARSPSAAERARLAEAEARAVRVEDAVRVLDPQVTNRSHPDALRYAVRAYHSYRSAKQDKVRNPYLYFVDYGLDSGTPRGYLFDMEALTVVEGPFNVAHGRGSVVGGADTPSRFLNSKDSNATSLGLYIAEETYAFRGKAGGRAYRSLGLRLIGVSGRFNDAARERGIVVHGAPYVTSRVAGRSEGCPAVAPDLAERLIPRIANGGLVFHFSPLDVRWLREDPWAGVITPSLAGTG